MDCFGTYFNMSKPNVTRVQSATQWTAWVHTLRMSKPNVTRVQSATQWTASVHTLRMSKPLQKNGNGIPAQERHLRKESGKMATEIAPKLRF